jgi:large subunit ribosomal protein L21
MQMYAIVEIAGRQFKVAKNDKIDVPSLSMKAGNKVKFDKVLLVGSDSGIRVGNPVLAGASVQGTVLGDRKTDKVIVFKKKKRKGYRVTRGHRQGYTQVEITAIA